MKIFTALLLLFAILAGPAQVAAMPDAVRGIAEGYVGECLQMTGRSEPAEAMISEADVTGDGQADWIIDTNNAGCSLYCGSAGCLVEMWSAHDGAPRSIFSSNIYTWRVDGSRGRHEVVLETHGSYCGRTGVEGCVFRMMYSQGELVKTGE